MNEVANPGLAANLSKAERHLARFRSGVIPHHIAGEAVVSASGATFEALDPATNAPLCTVAAGEAAEIDRAARAAEAAFPAWRAVSGARRRAILHAIADAIEARAEEIALVESADTGQPIRYMAKAALRGAENFRFYADRAPGARDGLSLPDEAHLNYTTRVPIGPVGVITPWNTPFMLSTWKIAPALAAGCTIVHKPAEWSPLSATILAEIMEAVLAAHGLPPGVVNLVQGLGETAGRALTEHPAIRAVAFVGETTTGRHIMAQGAATLKRVHFELGGKNPVVVFADADLDRALDATLFMIYSLNGERCTSSSGRSSRPRSTPPSASAWPSGSGGCASATPSIPRPRSAPHPPPPRREGAGYPALARAEGARVACGGGRAMAGEGNYVEPTLYLDAATACGSPRRRFLAPC